MQKYSRVLKTFYSEFQIFNHIPKRGKRTKLPGHLDKNNDDGEDDNDDDDVDDGNDDDDVDDGGVLREAYNCQAIYGDAPPKPARVSCQMKYIHPPACPSRNLPGHRTFIKL